MSTLANTTLYLTHLKPSCCHSCVQSLINRSYVPFRNVAVFISCYIVTTYFFCRCVTMDTIVGIGCVNTVWKPTHRPVCYARHSVVHKLCNCGRTTNRFGRNFTVENSTVFALAKCEHANLQYTGSRCDGHTYSPETIIIVPHGVLAHLPVDFPSGQSHVDMFHVKMVCGLVYVCMLIGGVGVSVQVSA